MANYNLGWSTGHPGLLVYLVDLSGSMQYDEKINRVSKIIADVLYAMVAPSQLSDGTFLDTFEVRVIGYNQKTYDIFSGNVTQLVRRLEEVGDYFFEFGPSSPFKAQGLTHMAMAFDKVVEVVSQWMRKQNAAGKPMPAPMVLHITDGFPEEKDTSDSQAEEHARQAAKRLLNIAVPDGGLLFFNMHIDGKPGSATPMYFPTSAPSDKRRKLLFDISSPMADVFVERGSELRNARPQKGSRFMVSNVSNNNILSELIRFGSSVSSRGSGQRETPIDV